MGMKAGYEEMSREELEKLALINVSADRYYDLADTISQISDQDLIQIVLNGADSS